MINRICLPGRFGFLLAKYPVMCYNIVIENLTGCEMPKNSNYEYVLDLLRKFKPMTFKIAFGILKSNADAEEAVQDAFVNIAKNIENVILIPPDEMVFYFTAVIKNACRDKLKAKKRHLVEDIDNHYEIASDYSVEEAVERKLLLDEVRSAITLLSNRDQQLLTLHFLEELPPKEIAAKMNISEKNIYKYIERAVKRLVKILNERGIHYEP